MNFKELMEKKEENDTLLLREGKVALENEFKEFLDRNQDVYAIGWVQYTPSFNDGDPCYFTFGDLDFYPSKEFRDEEYEEDEPKSYHDGIDWYGTWKGGKGYESKEADTLNVRMNILGDFLENFYGNSVQVMVTREGITIEPYEGYY